MILNPDGFVFGLFISKLLLIHLSEGQSQEADLSQTVRAMQGDDVVLPCHENPPLDVSQFTVEWGRPDLKPRFVHIWHNQKEYLADQNKVFKGRTSLFTDKLKDGNLSLKLSDVRHSDNGRYRCYNPTEKTENFIQLLVGSASSPAASLSGLDVSSSAVMLDCSAAGWYPEPEMFWLDGDGNIIMSAGAAEKSSDPDGVFTVSSRVTVEKRNSNNFTCRVQQKDTNQSRETHIHVPDDFFIYECSCYISISFNVILVIMFVVGVAFLILMKKQNKNKKKKLKKISEENEQMKLIAAARLDDELEKSNKEQKIINQQIKLLAEISEELKEQKKQLDDQTAEAAKMIEEDEEKFKAVDDEVTNQTGNMTEKKAQGYLKLKEIITGSKEKLTQRKQSDQRVGLMTDKLIKRTNDDIKRLEERKQEIENQKIKQLDQKESKE